MERLELFRPIESRVGPNRLPTSDVEFRRSCLIYKFECVRGTERNIP